MKTISKLTVLALCAASAIASAQTVTVAPTGADFTNVKDAVDSFAPLGVNNGNPADNVINITPGTYVEAGHLNLTENENYAIQGVAGTAIIIGTPGAAGGGTALIGSNVMNGKTLTLQNLTLLPTYDPGDGVTPNTRTGEAVRLGNGAAVPVALVANNVLISANNGSNAPASTGTSAASGHFTAFAGSGFRLLGGVYRLNLSHVTVTHVNTGVWDNGDIVTLGVDERVIGPGCRFSFNAGVGYNQGAAGITGINGTAAEPVIIANNGSNGYYVNSSPNIISGDINYLYVINNGDKTGDTANASGVHFVGLNFPNSSRFYKCIIALNGSGNDQWGNISTNQSQTPTMKFEQCTIFDAAYDQPGIRLVANSGSGTYQFVDCIIAGAGDYLFSNETDAVASFSNSAVVTAGTNAMRTDIVPAAGQAFDATNSALTLDTFTGAFTFTNVIHADPVFKSIDPASPDFLVVTNTAYATASSTGTPLVGATRYEPGAAVQDWSIY